MTCRIVTEGVTDEIILRALIAPHVPQSSFVIVPAGGFSPAISLARTLLLKGESEIVLVVDTDAVNEPEVQRRVGLAQRLLIPFQPSRYRIFMAVPAIEAWLFLDHKVAATLLGDKAPPAWSANVARSPKQVLRMVLSRRYRRIDLTALQKLLNETDLRPIANHQPVHDLVTFVQSMSATPTRRSG